MQTPDSAPLTESSASECLETVTHDAARQAVLDLYYGGGDVRDLMRLLNRYIEQREIRASLFEAWVRETFTDEHGGCGDRVTIWGSATARLRELLRLPR